MKNTRQTRPGLAGKIRPFGILLPAALAVLVLALLLGQLARPIHADSNATTHYVAVNGNCNGASPCYAVIQDAVSAAAPGDEIRVAAGTYSSVADVPSLNNGEFVARQLVAITETLTLRGGYSPTNWNVSDPDAQPTILDAQGLGRVMVISGTVSPVISGFHITGGNATGLGGALSLPGWCTRNNWPVEGGGGIFVIRASATIQDNRIYSNVGATTPGIRGGGGGILLNCSSATVKDNIITGNVGTTANIHAYGGGIYASGNGGFSSAVITPIIANNVISGNVAGGAYSAGGGIHVGEYINARITGNLVSHNVASQAQEEGRGGGISLLVGRNTPVIIDGNTIVSNRANQNSTGDGNGGGVAVQWVDVFTITNNIIAQNDANSNGSGFYLYNMQGQATNASLINNTISANSGSGDAVHFFAGTFISGDTDVGTLKLTNNIVAQQAAALRMVSSSGISGAIDADHTLWDGIGTYTSVSGSGSEIVTSNDLVGDPAFVGNGDYHITPLSAALDVGTNAGLDRDIDGQTRPASAAVDVGADELWPALSINYDTGSPGSFFTINAVNFPPDHQASIKVNGYEVGTRQTDAGGAVTFLLSTGDADEGEYVMTMEVNPQASVSFTIDADAPVRPQEGTGTVVTVPPGLAFEERVLLPMVTRP